MSYLPEDIAVMARTVWGEARGESFDGKTAVAWVIRNRAERGGWWGATIRDVCRKPFQFSCWNPSDPNLGKLQAVTIIDGPFVACLAASSAVLAGIVPDPTGGATHYHTLSISPKWAEGQTPTVTLGSHVFYKLEG